ncbi:zinc knuckle [Fusarium beomiforme]|uniref:Zinc knuckle n=1 Tax=Fusarium beomiforme TaxID=44412 RepID=A0A9P5E0H8_9HYPO|nr:zinc knuckle [Fusarium beomiforme]
MLKKKITKIAKQDAAALSRLYWDNYRRGRAQDHAYPSAATKDGWGPHNLKRYLGLSRAQSTMLIQCRTEVIGLNSYLRTINTVFHMFIRCPNLETPRRELFKALDHRDFNKMLSDQPEIAVDWAITHFDIPQFKSAKQDCRFNKPSIFSTLSADSVAHDAPPRCWLASKLPTMSTHGFLSLPYELRHQIYKLYYTTDEG